MQSFERTSALPPCLSLSQVWISGSFLAKRVMMSQCQQHPKVLLEALYKILNIFLSYRPTFECCCSSSSLYSWFLRWSQIELWFFSRLVYVVLTTRLSTFHTNRVWLLVSNSSKGGCFGIRRQCRHILKLFFSLQTYCHDRP
jgi:hypothetical protein